MKFTILRFDSINSTNTEALNQAKQGADEGLCVVAKQQTDGRGRHGRTWISEKDAGLYFSLVLRPTIESKFLPLLTLMSAVAVYDVLREVYKLKPDIKWANDVHINEKKVCGILAEMTETKRGLAVVIGIGINLKSSNLLPKLEAIATSIEQENNQKIDADKLLENLTTRLAKYYQILKNENGAEKIRQEWATRSTYFRGKSVTVQLGNESVMGTTRGLEESGALRVETKNGEIKIIHAGVVERLRKND
ncbi:MAG: biotin--[acetyl-CoA-carboxylase] ligase [Acidobacteria bacterium]|jgi:BirA family biotin operon repressor/biotin-[acetyl-CoA-carboxylase] ligase|nr:biotin--[acetyl-CoA-carboxylase] ligase [Acidobacteriota bacterium]